MLMSYFSEFSSGRICPPNAGHPLIAWLLLISLLAGCTANVRDQNALVSAASIGDANIVTQLLGAGANPDIRLKDGTTPLFMAAQQGHTKVVKLLLSARANPNARGYKSATPLIIAASVGHKSIVDLLLENRAAVDVGRDDKSTALYMASQSGYINIVRQLLAAGAKVNKPAYKGATALFIAAQTGHHSIAEELAKKGADVNVVLSNGSTPLIAAALKGHVSVTNVLLAYGADIGHKNQRGQDAMQVAKKEAHPELLAILTKADARIRMQKKIAREKAAAAPPVAKQTLAAQVAQKKIDTPMQTVVQPTIQRTSQATQPPPVVANKTEAAGAARQVAKPQMEQTVIKAQTVVKSPVAAPAAKAQVMDNKTPVPGKAVQPPSIQRSAQTPRPQVVDKKPVAVAGVSSPLEKPASTTAESSGTLSIADLIQQQVTAAVVSASTGVSIEEKPGIILASIPKVSGSQAAEQKETPEEEYQGETVSPPVVLALADPANGDTTANEVPVANKLNHSNATPTVEDAVLLENQPQPDVEEAESEIDDREFNNDPSAFGWSAEKFVRSVEELSNIRQDPPRPQVADSSALTQALTQAEAQSGQPVDGTYLYSVLGEAEADGLEQKPAEKIQTASHSAAVERKPIAIIRDVVVPDGFKDKAGSMPGNSDDSSQAEQPATGVVYRTALLLIRGKQYAKGASAMEAFLAQHPNDKLVPNAHYWSGVAVYAQGRFKQAASKFLALYKQYPRHDKAPDGLLNLARSLSALERNAAACTTLQKIQSEYPAAQSRLEAVVDGVSDRVCP